MDYQTPQPTVWALAAKQHEIPPRYCEKAFYADRIIARFG